MALNWNWNEKCGEAYVRNANGDMFVVNLYQGNAYLIFIYEYVEDGKKMYSLWSFWSDKEHAKVCLGLKKGVDQSNIYTAYESELEEIHFVKNKTRHLSEIVGLLTKAFDDITIGIHSEKGEDNE